MLVLALASNKANAITTTKYVKRDTAETNKRTNHCLENAYPVHIIVHICATKSS